jgi:DNA polymerase III epsilon subunit-like protein
MILWIDLETSGLDSKRAGIIELGYMIEDDRGIIVDEGILEINPFTYNRKVEISSKALEINGYTPEDLHDLGDSSKIFEEFIDILNKYEDGRYQIAGYNVLFDIKFLRAWFQDNSEGYLFNKYFDRKMLDVYNFVKCVRYLYPEKFVGCDRDKLGMVCECFSVELGDNAHSALDDIKATRELMMRILV